LKSFFCNWVDDSEMSTENQNQKRRVILVRKQSKPSNEKVGIERYDEYIEKSGLEAKQYQREGVEFCLRREAVVGATVVRGGIIADEMGLGKTMMMMGLILANLAAYRRTLIVVPVALIAQWVAQIKRTIIDTGVKPDLSVFVFHGSAGKRRVVLSEGRDGMVWWPRPPKKGAAAAAGGRAIDIVITTYGCVAMEEPAAAAKTPKTPVLSLLTFRPDRVIFDEAHHLRNKASRIFKGAMRVVSAASAEARRPSVWIVTGTPIQNKISDLKSLCYILGFSVSELWTEENRRAIRDEYVLRRTKVSVGMVVEAEAAGVEAEGAAEAAMPGVVAIPRLQSLKHYKSQVPWGSENELSLSREIHRAARNTNDRAERLKLYTRMRQMCVWPALLVQQDAGYGLSKEEYKVAVSNQSKLDRVVATMAAEAAATTEGTTTERKSLVFCHYRREMTRLRDMLLRGGGCGYGEEEDIAIIDGRVTGRERERILAAAPKVLILQIRTCSEGLNLQSYSDVYFISPHWNPCVEDQAIARCYRMGQTNGVRVFRFYMTDFVGEQSGVVESAESEAVAECISTLDHKCEEIQERKRVMCNEFLCGM
jgi:non-specific serine/threonine protein kinase